MPAPGTTGASRPSGISAAAAAASKASSSGTASVYGDSTRPLLDRTAAAVGESDTERSDPLRRNDRFACLPPLLSMLERGVVRMLLVLLTPAGGVTAAAGAESRAGPGVRPGLMLCSCLLLLLVLSGGVAAAVLELRLQGRQVQ